MANAADDDQSYVEEDNLMGSVISISGTQAGSGAWANIASYDPPANGRIVGVKIIANDDSDADGDSVNINVTFSSTAGAPSNGESSSICVGGKQFQVVTSGAVVNAIGFYCILPDIPIAIGQRIYLHALVTSGVTLAVTVQLHVTYNIPR